MSQTSGLIGLNRSRQLNRRTLFGLILLFLVCSFPALALSSVSSSVSNLEQAQTKLDVLPLQLYLNPANLDNASMAKLENAIEKYNIISIPKDQYTTSPKNGSSVMVTFTKFDSENKIYEYTLTAVEADSLAILWNCIKPQSCSFLPDINAVAMTKYILDKYLGLDNQNLVIKQENYNLDSIFTSFDVFNDLFFTILSAMLIRNLMEEKTKGLKFAMFMTGIRRSSYYIATFFYPVLIATGFGIWNILLYFILWNSTESLGPLSILVMNTCFSYIIFACICVQVASSERNAQLIYTLYFFVGYLSSSFSQRLAEYVPTWGILLLCVNPRIALSMYVYSSKLSPVGKGFSSLSVPFNSPSVNALVLTSCCFTVGLFLLGVYMNWLEVGQNETRPFHYPISRFFGKKITQIEERVKITPKVEDYQRSTPLASVSISNIEKLYPGSSTTALSDVSLEFSKGEIFGLLGYNGAGKSTLINILCGVIEATKGRVQVFGVDASTNREKVAAKTGICMQNDILFDELSVYDHLYHFGLIHGVPYRKIKSKIDTIAKDLELESMMSTLAKSLSGGEKRKLCVALAFINDPELVVLDEMSSGVDPENRRVLWNYLLKKKKDRAILLCTHFMDEADILCDRKAMLTQGQIVCIGTSHFLKETYNTGYKLSIEKSSDATSTSLFEKWFVSNGIAVTLLKSSGKIIDLKLDSRDLSCLKEFENDGQIAKHMASYSLQENGLDEIFMNKDLVDKQDVTMSREEQRAILEDMNSFVEPNLVSKTFYYFKFELNRFLASFIDIFFRMLFPFATVVGILVFFKSFGASGTTIETLPFSTIMARLLPDGFKLETNIKDLVSQNPQRFVPVNKTGIYHPIGALLQDKNRTITTIYGGYPGASLLSLNGLFPNSLDSTYFEFVSITASNLYSPQTLFIVYLIITNLYNDILAYLTEEICESKEKIKMLILSAGVSLESYWAVNLFRSFTVTVFLNLLVTVSIPPAYLCSPASTFVYLLQPILLSAVLGTSFSKRFNRSLMITIKFIGITAIIILPGLGQMLSWNQSTYQLIVNILLYIPPTTPLAIVLGSIFNIALPSSSTFFNIVTGYLVLFAGLLVSIELQHTRIKRIPHVNESFVSFDNAYKKYGTKVAVDGLELQIEKNEMLAILGPNGCGKTTSLEMLTALIVPDSGSVHVDKLHVASEKLRVIKMLGYCPQFDDLLIPTMTIFEHLELFCLLNGLDKSLLDSYINKILYAFGIAMFKNVNCGNLSGGTKRKVSTAIAAMFPRPLVVLDESSTGLDPLARQKLWNTVRLLNAERTTIMTTHYINETSNCDRIAIMTEGRVKVCGTEYELAKSHAKGYKVKLQFAESQSNLQDVLLSNLLDDKLEMKIDAVVGNTAIVHFSNLDLSLGLLIGRLVELKKNAVLNDFSITRVDLEQVFMDVVKAEDVKSIRLE
ncbi:hypothetical protein HDV04_001729 [Boothiomyces sp. JEL0838]|nr:hypothetical protein HDV04_001729 [Boothiomyces sp. JEL0838]